MSVKKRIVVTGMGVVSCFGNDIDQFFASLLEGRSGAKAIETFDCSEFPTKFAAYISDFDDEGYVDKKQARRIDPFIAYALVAGKKAMKHARVDLDALDKTRCGVLVGSGMGGMGIFVEGVKTLEHKGHKRVTPFFIPYVLTNMAGGLLAIDFGFMGPNYSISTACATGNYAFVQAAEHIRRGDVDLMICGGSEAAIVPMGISGFCACKALSTRNEAPEKASRPWDRSRDGFVMGEGCGVLVLESLEHAKKRGAPILAEYLGGGLSCDAHHMTEPRPDGEGIALCIRNALRDAGVSAEEIDYINGHGTSTPAGDMAEVRALKKVFQKPEGIFLNSTKSMTGHLLGAASGVEAIATIKSLQRQVVHPTINLEDPEPDLHFRVPTRAEKAPIRVALSNSLGFGGHNAAVVFRQFQD